MPKKAVKINISKFKKTLQEIHEKAEKTSTYKREISKHLTIISKDIITYIDKQMIEDNTMPHSALVRFARRKRKTPLKIFLPPRLSKIRKRTHNLFLSMKIERGEYTKIKYFDSKKLKISLYITNKERQAPYFWIQNYGGIIKAKNKYLTIPTHKDSFGKSPKRFDNLVKRGKILYRKEGRGLYRPLYILKKSVKLKPFHFVEKGLRSYYHSSLYRKRIEDLVKSLSRFIQKNS